jgi:hypothetical protein|tara:strand:+ start:994 stop:1248 length:255 start_codon:yes stop_codon:yes gene_type:complete
MAEYDNTNRGSIWTAKSRETDKHPHYTGTANVDGAEYWISAWAKDKDANPKAPNLTFSFKLKDNQQIQQAPTTSVDEDDEDLPF